MNTNSTANTPLPVEEGRVSHVICPHCETTLTSVSATLLQAGGGNPFSFGKRYIYACPACNKALGISHRKGFWMG